MDTFDRSKLNEYANRMLDQFLTEFPKETVYLLNHSENYYVPDGDRFIGAWVIEWLCPAGGYDWNIILSSSEQQLIIRWGGDHEHFMDWDKVGNDPEVGDCLERLTEILEEKIWNVNLFQGEKPLYGNWCKPNEVQDFVASEQVTKYKIKSWRGTFDQEVFCDQKSSG